MLTVLCVSHEWNLGFGDLRALANDGFSVLTASDGYDALHIFASQQIDALVVSRNLPDIPVDELARYVKLHQPGMPVVMLAPVLPAPDERPREIDATVAKTRARSQLAPTLRRLLRSGKMRDVEPVSAAPAHAVSES